MNETLLLDGAKPEDVAKAAELLRSGEIVVFPTDTVYGVGGVPDSAEVIEKIFAAKERPLDKGIPLLLSDQSDVAKVALEIPESAQAMMAEHWPGALTVIVPKRDHFPPNLSPNDGIAVRVPDLTLAQELIRLAGGALAVTSANRSGEPPAQTAQEAFEALKCRVAAVVDGGTAPGGQPSTIIQAMHGQMTLIRPGPIEIKL